MRPKILSSEEIDKQNLYKFKVGCVFPMVVVSILPHSEFGRNDHWEDAPHFNFMNSTLTDSKLHLIHYDASNKN